MLVLSSSEFESICNWAIDSLPNKFTSNLKNVAIVVEDEPDSDQIAKLHLVNGELLYGLYEGIPLTNRSGNYSLVLPDIITIFKNPILQNCQDIDDVRSQVKRTIWHEIAHHYGLDHFQINKILKK